MNVEVQRHKGLVQSLSTIDKFLLHSPNPHQEYLSVLFRLLFLPFCFAISPVSFFIFKILSNQSYLWHKPSSGSPGPQLLLVLLAKPLFGKRRGQRDRKGRRTREGREK